MEDCILVVKEENQNSARKILGGRAMKKISWCDRKHLVWSSQEQMVERWTVKTNLEGCAGVHFTKSLEGRAGFYSNKQEIWSWWTCTHLSMREKEREAVEAQPSAKCETVTRWSQRGQRGQTGQRGMGFFLTTLSVVKGLYFISATYEV